MLGLLYAPLPIPDDLQDQISISDPPFSESQRIEERQEGTRKIKFKDTGA